MYRKVHKKLQHANNAATKFGFSYPVYLKSEYDNEYQYKCKPGEFYSLIKEEIQECRIEKNEKKQDYKLWFGKFKGEKLFEIEDTYYLQWLCDVYRKKNKTLVGQALLRLEEL